MAQLDRDPFATMMWCGAGGCLLMAVALTVAAFTVDLAFLAGTVVFLLCVALLWAAVRVVEIHDYEGD